MAKIKIYGHSDDCVEVDGSVKGCDEYGYDKAVVILEPSGDRFLIEYGGVGVWCIQHDHISGLLNVVIDRAPEEDDPDPYTDTATVSGEIERVRVYGTWPVTASEIRQRVDQQFDRGLSDAEYLLVWEALGNP